MKGLKSPGKSCRRIIAVFYAGVQHLNLCAFKIISCQSKLAAADIFRQRNAVHVAENPLKKRVGAAGQLLNFFLVKLLVAQLQAALNIFNNFV